MCLTLSYSYSHTLITLILYRSPYRYVILLPTLRHSVTLTLSFTHLILLPKYFMALYTSSSLTLSYSHTLSQTIFTFPAALTLTHQYIPSYPLTLDTFCLFHILLCIYSISIIELSPTRCTYSHFRTLLCLYYVSLILFCSLTLSVHSFPYYVVTLILSYSLTPLTLDTLFCL